MKSIKTEIIINASVQDVWSIFIDFQNYPAWNPFIHISGALVEGANLENTIFLSNKKPQVFKPVVLKLEEFRELRWKGKLFVPGLFDGEHFFQFESITPQKTRMVHGEHFTGLLASVIYKMIGEETRDGFIAMNEALKKKAESINSLVNF